MQNPNGSLGRPSSSATNTTLSGSITVMVGGGAEENYSLWAREQIPPIPFTQGTV